MKKIRIRKCEKQRVKKKLNGGSLEKIDKKE